MKSLLNIIIILPIVLFMAGCSTTPEGERSSEIYSDSTESEFRAIELKDLERVNERSEFKPASKPIANAPVPKKSITKSRPATRLNSKNTERLQEINQNLAIFCMKKKNSNSFGSEDKCHQFTQNALKKCEHKNSAVNAGLLNCIKSELKKRP